MCGVPVAPRLHGLPISKLDHAATMNFAPTLRGWNTHQVPVMRSRRGILRHHTVAAREQMIDTKLQIRKRGDVHLHGLSVALTSKDGCGKCVAFPHVLFIEDFQSAFDVVSVPSGPTFSNKAQIFLLTHVPSPLRLW